MGTESGHVDDGTKLAIERTILAHERTELAWIRTAISLISFGFSIQTFFHSMKIEPRGGLIGPREFGLTMMLIGLCTLLLSAWEHRRVLRRLRARYPTTKGYPDIPRSNSPILGALIGLLGVLGLIAMLTR